MSTGPTHHGHLWVLPDGTGSHAPLGTLTREQDTGRLCCHVCGRWFLALGAHVRVHGLTAQDYRQAVGLCTGTPLAAAELSATISARQAARYAADPEHRARLAPGQEMARDGRLTEHSLTQRSLAGRSTPEPAQRAAARRRALARGRARRDEQRARLLVERLDALGARDLASHLRTAYAAGASLESLGRDTGLGRTRLRAELAAAGVRVRSQGENTVGGKRSRVGRAEADAAERVGTGDLAGWLTERRAAGWTLRELAVAVGRSDPWVRARLVAAPLDDSRAWR